MIYYYFNGNRGILVECELPLNLETNTQTGSLQLHKQTIELTCGVFLITLLESATTCTRYGCFVYEVLKMLQKIIVALKRNLSSRRVLNVM